MTTLHERLADLADLGAPGAPVDTREPAAAWQRGLRFRRRRRLGTAAIAVVALALLAGLGGTALLRSDSTIPPAGSTSSAGLPDRLYAPSPWLAGTEDEGPLGQLAVLIPAERGTWSGIDDGGVVGVSATTGEYRFLDLPDRAASGPLSPDGTRVAYWTTGPVTGTPNTAGGQSLTVGGIAVYDSTTGKTEKTLIESEHGLTADEILWADDETLVVGHGTYTVGDEAQDTPLGSGQGTHGRWYLWSVDDGAPTLTSTLPEGYEVEAATNGRVLTTDRVLDLTEGTEDRISFTLAARWVTALDPTGTRAALPGTGGENNKLPSKLQITSTDGSTVTVSDSARTYAAIGWSDRDHVAVYSGPAPFNVANLTLDLVDVRDGTRKQLVDINGLGNLQLFATDLLSAPTVEAVEPPHPWDPRWVVGGLTSIVALAGIALIRWRRRVTP